MKKPPNVHKYTNFSLSLNLRGRMVLESVPHLSSKMGYLLLPNKLGVKNDTNIFAFNGSFNFIIITMCATHIKRSII